MEPRPITGAARPPLWPAGPSSGGQGPCSPPRLRHGQRSARWQAGQLGFGVLGGVWGSSSLPPSFLPAGYWEHWCPLPLLPAKATSLEPRPSPAAAHGRAGGAKHTAPHHPGPFAPWHGQGLGARGCPMAQGWLRSTWAPSINWTLYFYNSFLCLSPPKKAWHRLRAVSSVPRRPGAPRGGSGAARVHAGGANNPNPDPGFPSSHPHPRLSPSYSRRDSAAGVSPNTRFPPGEGPRPLLATCIPMGQCGWDLGI